MAAAFLGLLGRGAATVLPKLGAGISTYGSRLV